MRDTLSIAVSAETASLLEAANMLAKELKLTLLLDPASPEASNYTYLLLLTPDYLQLKDTRNKKIRPFSIDFLSGKMLYRSQHAGLRKEAIARAIGFKPSEHPVILDATAGLGRDSFMLATLGFKVTLLERSPIIHALLKDALMRASKAAVTAPIVANLKLLHQDAVTWLKNPPFTPDVVYLDPMFPERQKSASVKKELVILQELLGTDTDSDELFKLALTCATHRVVVKRPRLAENLTKRAPNFSIIGKSSRFDVYLTSKT